jgi:hypothetical protein
MDYLSNDNMAYLSNDNVYKSTFGIVENNEIIDNDNDDSGEKNFLTDEQIQILLENYENKSNNNNKNLLFIIFFFLFFLIFWFLVF